ncbi:MAG TPA: sigma-70 family RNA polymerase sigma factor [Gemmataceae bacterium]|nr:sigma-70 family RNA polymerase sigma factor [Gemmataceae bacterium]
MATGQLSPILHYLRTMTATGAASEIADAELLSRFSRHRDEAAFTALVRRHGPMVLAVCRRVLRDGHTAEDTFQATFLVLARKAGSLARPELLGNWLHGVAYRTAVKARAETARRRTHEQQAVVSQEIGPDEDFIWRDVRAVLDEEVNRLPARYRVPVVLCYLQGQTNEEAARRLGCSRGTVATRLARAREKLRRRLTQRGVGLSVGVALVENARGGTVSRTLEHVTVKAATLLAAGQTRAVGALAAALAKGVSKGMLMEKLKIPVAILMMTAVVGTGAGITAYRVRAQESGAAESKSEAKPRPVEKTEKPKRHVTAPAEPLKDQKIAIRTENFIVTAATREIAERAAKAAEYNRKALARLWLDKELPTWAEPCPLCVTVTEQTTNSYSTFQFQDGVVLSKERVPANIKAKQATVIRGGMVLEGPLDRIFADLLPHEMTHTILAEWRGQPLPRWADEGAAMLSESAISRADHERAIDRFLSLGRLLAVSELLPNRNFPPDVTAFYAQSLSLTDFLVSAGGRKKFLAFVAQGEDDNWNKAAQSVYGYKTVKELEQAWLKHARMQLAERRSDEPVRPRQEPAVATASEPPKPRPAPAYGEALPASFKEHLPAGPPPVQALVILDEDDRLSVSRKLTYVQPVSEVVTLKNGQKRQITYYEEKREDFATIYDFRMVRVQDTKGHEVDKKKLRKQLKGERLALVSANGRSVDPQHLRLFKEDTLIFVLPSQAAKAIPGKDPIAPPPPHGATPLVVPAFPPVAPPPPVDAPAKSIPPSRS